MAEITKININGTEYNIRDADLMDAFIRVNNSLEAHLAENPPASGGGIDVFENVEDLPETAEADSMAFVKNRSTERFTPVTLKAADDCDQSTKLPYYMVRVAPTPPPYNESLFAEIANDSIGRVFDSDARVYEVPYRTDSVLKVYVHILSSAMGKYSEDIDWDEGIIPTTESTKDYCLEVHLKDDVYLDENFEPVSEEDIENLEYILQQYFYFYGSCHVYVDMGDAVLDKTPTEGWYAWVVKKDNTGDFSVIDVIPVDSPKYATITTEDTGCGYYSNEKTAELLRGVFETPERDGFYLMTNEGKWKNVVEGNG